MGCCYSNPTPVSPALEDIDTGPFYSGPKAEYDFINVGVTLSAKVSLRSTQLVTSDVDTYYPLLSQQYDKGYRLLSFYHIPGQGRRKGFFTPTLITTFQGIFCRYQDKDDGTHYRLRVEKAVIKLERGIFQRGCCSANVSIVSDISHMQQLIDTNAADGARLVCIELTGQEVLKRSWRPQLPSMGVDIFFDHPIDRVSETYIYNTVSVPILVTYTNSFRPKPVVHCDWQGTMDRYLQQGFKLIEIFMDFSNSSQASFCSGQVEIGSKWFFEKPTSKADDSSALYEGKVVEHYIKISVSGLNEMKTKAEWEPVIQTMGSKGWELACILETSNISITGFASYYMKVLLFFQRKLNR
ncbi:uncharacterized protein LOC129926855 isoform X1 [Biomphalaria glabrata]|uniref:Uncharacterized protein LOC129926855 isoform X1 n=1 Tax=Biomphalaria glabrata TaxID=6526 RepID=A0A9W3APZ4_BIOGL|nr:uncharacterized protein LOC129926855 isoform X1 [Biomphalaria glabrata]KAI8770278.1 raftlin-like [Biomphalaria glabrata]